MKSKSFLVIRMTKTQYVHQRTLSHNTYPKTWHLRRVECSPPPHPRVGSARNLIASNVGLEQAEISSVVYKVLRKHVAVSIPYLMYNIGIRLLYHLYSVDAIPKASEEAACLTN